MHHHGYLWTGPKQRFDEEALRRPAHPLPPPGDSRPELIQRYREVHAAFPVADLPPLEIAHWLTKPEALVRGTWAEPKDAAGWLAERVADFAGRFAAPAERDQARLATLVPAAVARLAWGGDVARGFYLERPSYLHLSLVTCSPNRAAPRLDCPLRRP
ncbi:hypothetical protein ABZX40_30705 [Streptomyces sp. NPDC004610]|uniref:hypothetical protein n=1 Tax=unclassified Streptomyces TaxID=2593676 RepID=UPI0033A5C749